MKYPKSAYRYLQLLLGQKYDSPLVTKYRQWFPYYDMKEDEERGQAGTHNDEHTHILNNISSKYSRVKFVSFNCFFLGTVLFQHDR